MKRPYLVGSMAADRAHLFEEAEQALKDAGFDPINPTRSSRLDSEPLNWVRYCLHDLADSDGIATLEGHDEADDPTPMALVRAARDLGFPVGNVETWIGLEGEFG